ncbi:MAG: veratrol--corrinoid protein metyltransferase [Coriobacteriia bacterium]|nr:veratrol--corrinoid protein metyltransferase [Coriobacteriia bacterium]
MAKITPKENFLKLAGGGHPEYVPYYTFMGTEGTKEIAIKNVGAAVYPFGVRADDGSFTDMWGVPYKTTEETANAGMPEPGRFILEDVTKWGDIIKRPEPDNLDFEAMLKASMERTGIDRSVTAMSTGFGFQPFQTLMAFMGHTEGLIAMHEEPEAVKELLEYLLETYEPYAEKICEVFQPDVWNLGDDTCTERDPFFSVEMYKEFFKPIYTRLAAPALKRGLPVIFHICGRIEPFIDDMLDFGVKYVEPAQETNDIMALKEKYKGRLSYIGGYDWGKHVPPNYPNFDEEWIRQDVRDAIDRYSPGGAYGFLAWPISYLGDEAIEEVKKIIWDEAVDYGKKVYGYPVD